MIIADGSSVWGECVRVTKCFYVNGRWRAPLRRDINIQRLMRYSVSLWDVSSVTVKCSVFIWKVQHLSVSWRPQREKMRWRGLEAEDMKTWQSLHQSREKVGHMGGDRGCSSIYRKHLWITGRQVKGRRKWNEGVARYQKGRSPATRYCLDGLEEWYFLLSIIAFVRDGLFSLSSWKEITLIFHVLQQHHIYKHCCGIAP